MKLSLTDFKNCEREEYDLEGSLEIVGRNGVGKTTILEGIIFALFGRTYWGSLTTDRYKKKGSASATATLTLGNTEIKRSIGKESSVWMNGTECKISDVASMFPSVSMVFPALNPLFFIYQLGDKDKRDLFMKLLPRKDRVEIFKEYYSDDPEMVDKFKSFSVKQIKDQLKEYEKIIAVNSEQIASYKLDISNNESEVARLKMAKGEVPEGVLNREKETQKQINEKRAELSKLGNPNVIVEQATAQIAEYKEKVVPYIEKLKVKNLTEAIDWCESKVSELLDQKTEYDKKVAELELETKQLEQFESGKCPLCGQDVESAPQHIEDNRADLDELKISIDDIAGKATKVSSINAILRELRSKIEEVSRTRQIAEGKIAKFDRLNKEIEELEEQLLGNSKEDFEKAVELEAAADRIKQLNREGAVKKTACAKLTTTNEKLTEQIPELELLLKALKPSGVDAAIAKDQASKLEEMLSKYVTVKIRTIRENKTNDKVREVFDVFVDGVEFDHLSFGERIKVAVAFSLILRELIVSFNLPFMLIDEASVLSKETLKTIREWCKDIDLIVTKAEDSDLVVRKM